MSFLSTATRNDPRSRDVLNHPRKENVDNAIRAHGIYCEIRKGTICPCLDVDTRQPKINCGICFGVGYFFDDALPNPVCPIGSTKHKVAMGQRNYSKRKNKEGGYDQAGIHTALIYTYIPSDGDLIKPLADIEVINDEPHVKGSTFLGGASAERLFHEDIAQVEMILEANATLTGITKYYSGTNFNMNGNVIEWITGAPQPATGKQYIVRYAAHPSYIIFNTQPTLIIEHDDALPRYIREQVDTIYPYQVQLERLDRKILGNQKQIGI